MSVALNALMTKLNWKKQELDLALKKVENDSITIIEQMKTIESNLNQSTPKSLMINPELEMNRLNFMMIEQEKIAQLTLALNELNDTKKRIKDSLIRINTERKMLEKYLENKKSDAVKQEQKHQEHRMDEWALVNKEIA